MDLQTAVALSLLPVRCRARVAEVVRESMRQTVPVADRLCGSDEDVRRRFRRAHLSVPRVLQRAAAAGLVPVAWSDARYPALLGAIVDPPPVVWVRGAIEALDGPSVAIVGSRAASAYALQVAERLGHELAARGVTVVSGLARGADSAAHRGAVAAGGPTVAVLGSGADIVYPPEHARLAGAIVGRGALVSEFAPGTPPRPYHFPLRNRIISGLSLAVVVVEAAERSGSLITARSALEQGREVMAVPGNVLSGRNRGAHALLKDGARLVESVDDILDELQVPLRHAAPSKTPAPRDPVLALMQDGEPYDLDALVAMSGVAAPRLLPRLLELELGGEIARAGGGRFVRRT